MRDGGKKMIDIGRLCVKTAGRDAGKKCVIIEILDDNHALIDGETRRRKCNLKHLEPLAKTITVGAKRDHASIIALFKKAGLKPRETKPKQKTERVKKQRKQKEKKEAKKPKAEKKAKKKEEKKAKE
jgi:large subunit ribosomal protein L14e